MPTAHSPHPGPPQPSPMLPVLPDGPAAALLDAGARQTLLHVARVTLANLLERGCATHWHFDCPVLCAPRACFVTLRRRDGGALRGCRGETHACRPLYAAVALMAAAAALDDPRFLPVRREELPLLRIEISVLTPLVDLCPEAVTVGRHGLLVTRGRAVGLLLPQVAAEWGWEREAFLAATCIKAGLPADAWRRPGTQLRGFECEVFGEAEPPAEPIQPPAPAARPPGR